LRRAPPGGIAKEICQTVFEKREYNNFSLKNTEKSAEGTIHLRIFLIIF
jgi:hypothetical protein